MLYKNNSILITATASFYCQIIQGLQIENDYKAELMSQLSAEEENCKIKCFFSSEPEIPLCMTLVSSFSNPRIFCSNILCMLLNIIGFGSDIYVL